MLSNKGCHVKTRIPSSTYTFKWTVEHFSKLSPERIIHSSEFHPISGSAWSSTLEKCPPSIRWIMKYDYDVTSLSRSTDIDHSRNYLLEEKLLDYNRSDYFPTNKISEVDKNSSLSMSKGFHVQHNVSIVDSQGKIWLKKRVIKKYDRQNRTCSLIDDSDEISYSEMNLLKRDVLTFSCFMTFTGDTFATDKFELEPEILEPAQDLEKLSDDLKLMYGVSLYTDVCLRIEGEVLRAHRAILCARSPVFAKMFEHKLEEAETNSIDIVDLNVKVLKELLSYIYTGVLADESFDSVLALYYAADKYDVDRLRQRCGQILHSKLTVDNACKVLVLADRHSDESLKKSVIKFIDIYLESIMATEDWIDLVKNETKVAAEVLQMRTENCTSKQVEES